MTTPERQWSQDEIDHAMGLDDSCWQCFGRGWVASCFEEYACIDPDEGCEDCLHPCDICNTSKPPRPDAGDF